MLIRYLTTNLQLQPFQGRLVSECGQRMIVWGVPERPSRLIIHWDNPPPWKVVSREPTIVELDIGNVTVGRRNFLVVAREMQGNVRDLFLAVQLWLPHGLVGHRAIQVHTARGLDTKRVFCDHAKSVQHADGGSQLALWAFAIIRAGDKAELLTQAEHNHMELFRIWIKNDDGRLEVKRTDATDVLRDFRPPSQLTGP